MSIADSIALGVQHADWWDLVPASVGALVGAAVASVPAWLLARKSSKETLERDRTERLEQQTADSLSALVKLISIVNGAADLHRTIEEQITEAEKAGHGEQPLWCRVQGIIGLVDDRIRFGADELAPLAAAKDFDYLLQLMLVAARYSTLVVGLRDYAERRRSLTDQVPAKMEGNVGTILLTDEANALFAPRAVELETQITELRARAAKDCVEAAQVAEQFGGKIKKQLGLADFPTLKAPLPKPEAA